MRVVLLFVVAIAIHAESGSFTFSISRIDAEGPIMVSEKSGLIFNGPISVSELAGVLESWDPGRNKHFAVIELGAGVSYADSITISQILVENYKFSLIGSVMPGYRIVREGRKRVE